MWRTVKFEIRSPKLLAKPGEDGVEFGGRFDVGCFVATAH
jgi:hypothetical protein